MSTNSLIGLMPETVGVTTALFGKVRTIMSALAEAKAACDSYETLTARGVPPSEASQAVFRRHFGKR